MPARNRFIPFRCLCAASLFLAIIAMRVHGAESGSAAEDHFEKFVRPLLVDRCYECHSEDSVESGLRLDSLGALLRGGERGPAIVPGKPEASLLIAAVRHGELLKMPPKSKLTSAEVRQLERWIEMGAPWPGSSSEAIAPVPATTRQEWTAEQRSHWAFQPRVKPHPPSVDDSSWIQTPIDAFILDRIRAAGLSPAAPASKQTLIRRLTFDLIGLPPTPEEIDHFLADESPEAYLKLVDRLLASPRYGERWGRHWLDLARYADSNGLDENLAYANAFRYRDYVIRSFNADKPFDRFASEQLAGDLLGTTDGANSFDALVATGFLSLGAKMLAEDDPVKMQMDIVDEQVDTIGRVFLGMTLGCARCHDHKFDPIDSTDYYALAGILKSTKTMETHTVVARWLEQPLASSEQRASLAQHQDAMRQRDAEIKRMIDDAGKQLLGEARRHLPEYLLAAWRAEQFDHFLSKTPTIGDSPEASADHHSIVIEAENYVRGNVLKDTSNYGAGIGVLVNRGESPNFAEYEIDIPTEGLYRIELRYAAAASRPTLLSVNGRVLKSDAAGRITGSWNADGQKWYLEGFYPLHQGKNVVRLEQPTAFPHIDKLLVAPVPAELAGQFMPTPQDAYQPIPEFVSQWRKFLANASFDSESPLSAWREATREQLAPDPGSPATQDGSKTAPRSADLIELAVSIGQRAGRVIDQWELIAASGVKEATLPDPTDDGLRRILFDAEGPFALPKSIEKHFSAPVVEELARRRAEKSEAEAKAPKFDEAMAVADGTPLDLAIHIRGSHLTLGPTVSRGFPRMLASKGDPDISPGTSGRRELANWIMDPENPLTARVIVNRIWQWHLGEGLVRSPDNFGMLGLQPTHPELLDWLAATFVESDWSIKELHRLIVSSSVYQMSCTATEDAFAADPENLHFSRFNRRRVEAEIVRDAVLAAAGELDFEMGGTLLRTENRQYVTSTANVNPVVYETSRRSVYLPVIRSALYEVFQAFDFADPSVSQGKRDSTTVAPQALFMMNSKVVADRSRSLAKKLLDESGSDDQQRVIEVFRRCFGRNPTESEMQKSLDYVGALQNELSQTPMDPIEARTRVWQSFCRAVFSTNEFIYVE